MTSTLNRSQVGALNRQRIVEALRTVGAMSAPEISALLGLSLRAVLNHINAMRERGSATPLRVAHWTKNQGRGGRWVAHYELGLGVDARCPRMSRREQWARSNRKRSLQKRIARAGGAANPFSSLIAQVAT